jgi:hypothetical protein
VDRRDELLRAEAEGWDDLTALLAGATRERLRQPGLDAEGWSVTDVLWHLAYWCADADRALGQMRDGVFDASAEPEGSDRVDAINAAQLRRSQAMAFEEARARLHRARAGMLERVGELPELSAEADEWLEESGPLHYAEHLPALRAWLAGA